MKYLSLFSGIGGFELGIKQAYGNLSQKTQKGRDKNIQRLQSMLNRKSSAFWRGKSPACIGYSEINKYAIQVYEKHFKHKNYGDITKINTDELPDFDFVVGGFPCQSFSIAGKRGGFNDTRGTLFFEIARILRDKRPRYFLLENVKGLLSSDSGKTFQTILKVLSDIGYDCQWQVLNSKNFGVPQNRERVFIIGHLRGTGRPKVFPIRESNGKNYKKPFKTLNSSDWRGANRNQGQNLVEITKNQSQGYRVYDTKGISSSLASEAGGVGAKTGLYAIGGTQKNVAKMKDQSPALTEAMGKGGGHTPIIIPEDMKIRRLTPTECERLQGFPDGWTEGLSDTQRYKTLGNAVTVNVIKAIMERLN